jgi:hypothetical protein
LGHTAPEWISYNMARRTIHETATRYVSEDLAALVEMIAAGTESEFSFDPMRYN